jgi:hypothetical protein
MESIKSPLASQLFCSPVNIISLATSPVIQKPFIALSTASILSFTSIQKLSLNISELVAKLLASSQESFNCLLI